MQTGTAFVMDAHLSRLGDCLELRGKHVRDAADRLGWITGRARGDEQCGVSMSVWDLFLCFCGFARCVPVIPRRDNGIAWGLVAGAIEASPKKSRDSRQPAHERCQTGERRSARATWGQWYATESGRGRPRRRV